MHYNHCVSPSLCPSIRGQLVKMLITRTTSNFAYLCMSTNCLTTDVRNSRFLMDEALLSISQAGRGQFVKMLITLEPHGILGPNFAYLYISSNIFGHWFAKR